MRKNFGNRITLEGIVKESENGVKKISNSALKNLEKRKDWNESERDGGRQLTQRVCKLDDDYGPDGSNQHGARRWARNTWMELISLPITIRNLVCSCGVTLQMNTVDSANEYCNHNLN